LEFGGQFGKADGGLPGGGEVAQVESEVGGSAPGPTCPEGQFRLIPDGSFSSGSLPWRVMDFGKLGVWWSGSWHAEDASLDVAAELESIGYTALWSSGGFEPGLSKRFERLLASTKQITVASGIVSVWAAAVDDIVTATTDLENRYPGRFALGIGASHAPVVESYERPFSKVRAYLDELDDSSSLAVAKPRRVVAALGDRMLGLAGERALGAHPYFVPAEHTSLARSVLGDGPLLAPEVTVVLESDPGKARALARSFTTGYLGLENYSKNIRSLGFTEDDVSGGGSDRLVDAVVCWGSAQAVARKVGEHYEAGADHVCIQVVHGRDRFPIDEYRELAGAILERLGEIPEAPK